MRIVAGKLRGKPLAVPEGRDVRPTSDRAREAVFNVLAHRFANDGFSLIGATVVDAFAGTGALGLEAWSRGAAKVTFIENGQAALKALSANIKAAKADKDCRVVVCDAAKPLRAIEACDLAFLDPPYDAGLLTPALDGLARQGWLAKGAIIVAEGPAKGAVDVPDGFSILDERTYGKARVLFLRFQGVT